MQKCAKVLTVIGIFDNCAFYEIENIYITGTICDGEGNSYNFHVELCVRQPPCCWALKSLFEIILLVL